MVEAMAAVAAMVVTEEVEVEVGEDVKLVVGVLVELVVPVVVEVVVGNSKKRFQMLILNPEPWVKTTPLSKNGLVKPCMKMDTFG